MNLIPMETFEGFRIMKIAYTGFVWEKDGSVYSVISRSYTEKRDTPSYPFDKMPVTRGTTFYETKTEHIVSLLELKEDLVFDEKGVFIEKKVSTDTTSANPSRIFIRKSTSSGIKDIPIAEASLVNEESYIQLFTSVLSDFKDIVITPRHLTGPILFLSGQRIKALKPVGALGSRKGSSIASWGLSKVFPKQISKETSRKLERILGEEIVKKSTNPGRIAGRAVPYVGWALTAADVIYSAYELGGEYGPMTMYLKNQRKKAHYESVILRDLDKYIDEY